MNDYRDERFFTMVVPSLVLPFKLKYFRSFSQFKIWVKPGAEQSFLYGNHILKSGLGRITDNTPRYQGVVIYSMADVPLVSIT